MHEVRVRMSVMGRWSMSAEDNTPATDTSELARTSLYACHQKLAAKFVPFAGYHMPVQYDLGVLKEHLWTREKAGLFDVSHMGQCNLIAADTRHETVAAALEALVPADILNLKPGRQRYTQLLNADGGIIDDLMVTRPESDADAGKLRLIVNAACKEKDYAHIQAHLPAGVTLAQEPDRALIALQGPAAADVLGTLSSQGAHPATSLAFMQATTTRLGDWTVRVARAGYTGEDGFEISVSASDAPDLWQTLMTDDRVAAIGLGARDSLRLEAGLCLYGHDIDETTTPVEADLGWSIQKRRRQEGGFPGSARIQKELLEGPMRLRVGIRPEGRAPAREGVTVHDQDGNDVGRITSGGFGPSVGGPIAMGYVSTASAAPATLLGLAIRAQLQPARTVALPFVAHNYARKT